MKTLHILFAVAATAVCLAACNEKKQEKTIIAKKPAIKVQTAPAQMQDYNHRETVEWIGRNYEISISRHAETSLPQIVDDAGNKYFDNRITLRIAREDGSVFLDRTFGKADFEAHVGENYAKKSALLGMVIDHVDGDDLVFAASVGSPDVLSDDYVPLLVTVSRMGSISIKKDTRNLNVEN